MVTTLEKVASGRRIEDANVSAFLIAQRWPAKHADRLQLYSLPTPNGVKVSIMLEEIGLPYEAHLVDFNKHDQHTREFLSFNPNGKIPAILDPNGPGGKPLPPVRSRRDPAIPCGEDRQAPALGRRAALADHPVGAFPDGRDRADVWPGRLLQQIRRQRLRGQAPSAALRE